MEVESRSLEVTGVGECESVKEVDDSQLAGGAVDVAPASDHVVGGEGGASAAAEEPKADAVMVNGIGDGKRKRGRPPRGQAKTPVLKMTQEEEEDVCFICFDGGSLVLCDRRGCPKAYHPACIKRDEAFFQSKAKWNCGWHICSSCRKASSYMCYTCTFSLCKGCIKDAEYVCVRENKGFCTTCLRTILLIENIEPGNKEMAQVDFDDKSSWEYLFKVYWVYLKEKLSLTLSELNQARNPWKGSDTVVCSGQQIDIHHKVIDEKDSLLGRSSDCLEVNSKRRKTTEHLECPNRDSQGTSKLDTENRRPSGSEKVITSVKLTEWATKELLEFVALMKNGDTTVLSQFDVQSLLLEYIKRNNLRDPRRKSEIICDLRLRSLFGKSRVGHIEMLKLLEFHFLIKEESQINLTQCNIVDSDVIQMDGDENYDNQFTTGRDKRRKTRKKGEERGPQINLSEYAAIDAHNIKLIYLRRDLMESLIEDTENFHEKVVGSIVRIRISSSDQKQDMYRLVQVVGTTKVTVPYTISKKTADVMLEILNLNKKEALSIDAISNQEFSEDECNRLRQSIKCGLVKRLTVGDMQKKAIALQAVRINDWLETEVLRLNHLRDRASEKGHKRELREYVERLQLLKTPEERQRRLHEIPVVHADSHMDPNYESEDDINELSNKKQDEYATPRYAGFSRKGKDPNSRKGGDISNDSCNRGRKSSVTCEESKSNSATSYPVKLEGPIQNGRKHARGSNNLQKTGNQVDTTSSMIGSSNNQADTKLGSFYGNVAETATSSLSSEVAPSISGAETDKLWSYRDPKGKIQGPFSVVQLRKWSTTGYFPPDMRIWVINDEQNASVLLTDVLNKQFHTTSQLHHNISQLVGGSSDGRLYNCDVQSSGTELDGKGHSGVNNEFMKSHPQSSPSSDETSPVKNSPIALTGGSSQSRDSFTGIKSCSDQVQHEIPSTLSNDGKNTEVERWNSGANHGNGISHGTPGGKSPENSYYNQGHLGQSSGQNWRPLSVNVSSTNKDSSSIIASVANSIDTVKQSCKIDIPDLPSPTPKTSSVDWNDQVAENKQSVLSKVPDQESHFPDLPSPTPMPTQCEEKGQAGENRTSVSSAFPIPDSGPSWSSASSLVVGNGSQLRETPPEWGGSSPTPAKPSVEEWQSTLASVPSLKLPEVGGDHASSMPTSNNDQLTYSSSSHPVPNVTGWQLIIGESIEFSTLGEESVSDLLAEVDAMESQCGLGSPTSVMNCGEELIQGSENDCFSSMEGLSPTLDPGKSDALSSTGDAQLPSRSVMTDEPLGLTPEDVLDHVRMLSEQSSTSSEVEGEAKSCTQLPPGLSSTSQNMADMNAPGCAETRALDTQCRKLPESQFGWGGSSSSSAQGFMNTGLDTSPSIPAGGHFGWESHHIQNGYSRGKHWQSFGGEGYAKSPSKGQRVCKFYESGYCKKGASCAYLHP